MLFDRVIPHSRTISAQLTATESEFFAWLLWSSTSNSVLSTSWFSAVSIFFGQGRSKVCHDCYHFCFVKTWFSVRLLTCQSMIQHWALLLWLKIPCTGAVHTIPRLFPVTGLPHMISVVIIGQWATGKRDVCCAICGNKDNSRKLLVGVKLRHKDLRPREHFSLLTKTNKRERENEKRSFWLTLFRAKLRISSRGNGFKRDSGKTPETESVTHNNRETFNSYAAVENCNPEFCCKWLIFILFTNSPNQWKLLANQWGPCALHHWIQNSMEAILTCHPAVSTEWLAGWQFRVYYDVCARSPLKISRTTVCSAKSLPVTKIIRLWNAKIVSLWHLFANENFQDCSISSEIYLSKSWDAQQNSL